MSTHIKNSFAASADEGRLLIISYILFGYPAINDSVPLLRALQRSGVDIIELGMPFTDPIADSPGVQRANQLALKSNIKLTDILSAVAEARRLGVHVPIVLRGYYNPIYRFGDEKFINQAQEAGVDGVLLFDLPPDDAASFSAKCQKRSLSFIPVIGPLTSKDRIKRLASMGNSYLYVMSPCDDSTAKTMATVREAVRSTPLVLAPGITEPTQLSQLRMVTDGVCVGTDLVPLLGDCESCQREDFVADYILRITQRDPAGIASHSMPKIASDPPETENTVVSNQSSAQIHPMLGRFGRFGGRYVPEMLDPCLSQLEAAFYAARDDPQFWEEFRSYYPYMGRPSPLHVANRLTEHIGGARIWLKREDLNHTGSHKINNALAQVLLARRMGKRRIIAETGAGQHGVATATAAAKFGMPCTIVMGAEDVRRQALNVFRMKLLGAEVISVTSGTQTLRDACSEALQLWVTRLEDTYYVLGSAVGPHPFPTMVRTFQSIIGQEIHQQFPVMHPENKLRPDYLFACIGGGSNAFGTFSEFVPHTDVQIIGVEAAGDGINSDKNAATLSSGQPGVIHGMKTYVLQNENGQITDSHSISAGLNYPGVGPEISAWKDTQRMQFMACDNKDALRGFRLLSEVEGIIPAIESSHALIKAADLAATLPKDADIVVTISGRGDKGVAHVAELLPTYGPQIGWDLRFG